MIIINNFINKINPRQFFIASIIIVVVDYFALQLFLAPLFKEFIPNIQNKPMKNIIQKTSFMVIQKRHLMLHIHP